MTAGYQFHVVDRATAQGQPLMSQSIATHPWQFAIYRHVVEEPSLVYGKIVALCHDEDDANAIVAALNATSVFLATMIGDKT